LEEIREKITVGDHLNMMYQIVEDGVLGKVEDYRNSRKNFEKAFRMVSF
jgi:hypothetical protein